MRKILYALAGACALVLLFPPTRYAVAEAIASAVGASGSAAPTLTLQMGGSDGTNLRSLKTDASGFLGAPGFNAAPFAPRACDKIALFNAATIPAASANTVLVAGVASQSIYVCDISLGVSTAVAGTAVRLVEGSGTACATSPANVGILQFTTPTAAPTAPNYTPLAPVSPPFLMTATSGDALCIQQASTTNTSTFTGWVHYTQN